MVGLRGVFECVPRGIFVRVPPAEAPLPPFTPPLLPAVSAGACSYSLVARYGFAHPLRVCPLSCAELSSVVVCGEDVAENEDFY